MLPSSGDQKIPCIGWKRFQQELPTVGELREMGANVKAEFISRYESFENEASVEQFVAALRELNQIGKELGIPDSLRLGISDSPSPPDQVYASIMWVSMRAGDTASAISPKR